MTHELGHYFSASISSYNPGDGEPLCGEAIAQELGQAYIAWMFGGLSPEATSNVKDTKAWDFRLGMMWQPWYQRGETQQTFGTAYSMRLDHVEMIMT
jgi:hypothetical protein